MPSMSAGTSWASARSPSTSASSSSVAAPPLWPGTLRRSGPLATCAASAARYGASAWVATARTPSAGAGTDGAAAGAEAVVTAMPTPSVRGAFRTSGGCLKRRPATALSSPALRASSSGPREHRVLVRVRRRAAAQEHERLARGGPELGRRAGRDHDAVAGAAGALLPAQPHAPGARREEVDL